MLRSVEMRVHVAVLALVLAGCGSGSQPKSAPAPVPTPRAAATPVPPKAPQLVYVWRNFEFTGVPEEMTIYTNGEVRYRNLLHTQQRIKILSARLRPGQLARIRTLLGDVDLRHADASNVKPRRDGFRYVIRSQGRVGTAADGHLHGAIRPLVAQLRTEMDHMSEDSL
jgi:hypothetical protein